MWRSLKGSGYLGCSQRQRFALSFLRRSDHSTSQFQLPHPFDHKLFKQRVLSHHIVHLIFCECSNDGSADFCLVERFVFAVSSSKNAVHVLQISLRASVMQDLVEDFPPRPFVYFPYVAADEGPAHVKLAVYFKAFETTVGLKGFATDFGVWFWRVRRRLGSSPVENSGRAVHLHANHRLRERA